MKTDGSAERLDNHLIGTVVSINVSGGGVPKSRVSGAQVSRSGLVGDAQDDTIHHGGPERAVCLYSLERIRSLPSVSGASRESAASPADVPQRAVRRAAAASRA